MRCRLVQHQHDRVGEQGAGEQQPLALATGQVGPVGAGGGGPTVRQFANELAQPGPRRHCVELVISCLRPYDAQVVAQRGVEDVIALQGSGHERRYVRGWDGADRQRLAPCNDRDAPGPHGQQA